MSLIEFVPFPAGSAFCPAAGNAFCGSDWVPGLLTQHSGLYSVQLQPPGTQAQEPQKALPANGQKALPAANGTNSSRAMVEGLLALVTPEEE